MEEIRVLTWVLLFFSAFTLDIFTVLYTKAIVAKRGLRAANISVVLFLLSVYGTINYISDPINIVPIALGYWLGSYVSVRQWREEWVEIVKNGYRRFWLSLQKLFRHDT